MAQEDESTLNKVGDKAPAFKATTIDGQLIDTKDLKGKVIWVNFFATWCPPCKKELPVLQDSVYLKYKDNKDFVLVVLGREHTVDELKEFASNGNMIYHSLRILKGKYSRYTLNSLFPGM